MSLRLFAMAASAAALLAAGHAAAAPAPPKTVELYAIDCGRFPVADADMFSDDGAYKGVARNLVVPCYLIRHPKGDLIWYQAGTRLRPYGYPTGFVPNITHQHLLVLRRAQG